MMRPAGSSAALLILRPDDSFSILADTEVLVWSRLRRAFKAVTLVLILRLMDRTLLPEGRVRWNPSCAPHSLRPAFRLGSGERHLSREMDFGNGVGARV